LNGKPVTQSTPRDIRHPFLQRLLLGEEGNSRPTAYANAAFVAFLVYLFGVALGVSGVFNGVSPLFQGQTFVFSLLGGALLVPLAVYTYAKPLTGIAGWLSAFVWLLPLSYLIAQFQTVSPFRSETMAYANVAFACLFLCGAAMLRGRTSQLFRLLFLVSGYGIVLFGLMHWFGMHGFGWLTWLPGKLGWLRQLQETGGIYVYQVPSWRHRTASDWLLSSNTPIRMPHSCLHSGRLAHGRP